MVAGLLVLVGLLLSGVQGPATAAMLHSSHHHDRPLMHAVDAAHSSLAAPSGDHHGDAGLLCCLVGQCTMQPFWFADTSATFPEPLLSTVSYRRALDRRSPGIGARPTPPPPRTAA